MNGASGAQKTGKYWIRFDLEKILIDSMLMFLFYAGYTYVLMNGFSSGDGFLLGLVLF